MCRFFSEIWYCRKFGLGLFLLQVLDLQKETVVSLLSSPAAVVWLMLTFDAVVAPIRWQ